MGFFTLPTTLVEPVDEFTAVRIPVRDDAEDLVALLLERHGGKGELSLHARKLLLFHKFTGGDVPVNRGIFGKGDLIGNKADLGPLLARLTSVFRDGFPFLRLGHRFFELFCHISPYGELDPAETLVLPFLAILEEIVLIAGGIGTEIDLFHSLGEHVEGFGEYPELIKSRGDVPVPELRVEDKLSLRPPDVEGLIRLVPLVGEQGVFFLRMNEGRIHVEGRFCTGMVSLDGGDEIPVYLNEAREVLIRRRDESLTPLALLLFLRVMEGCKIPKDGGPGRNGSVMLLPPPSLPGPSLLTGKPLCFYPAEHFGEALVLCKNPDVVDRVSAREVEQYQGSNNLLIRPSPNLHVHMDTDAISQAEDGGEVEVDGKTGEGG